MAIRQTNKRLQYRYYSFRENPNSPPGEDWRFKTFLPMKYDSVYNLPDSFTYADALSKLMIDGGKNQEEAEIILKDSNGYFRPDQSDDIIGFLHSFNTPPNPNNWNGIICRDGKKSNFLPRGVTFQYNSDSVVAIIDTSDTGFGAILSDSIIEIVLERAKSSTPWFFYGTNRYDLATRLGREATGMGGVHPSVVPADAIQMTYRMDNDVTTSLGLVGFVVPFVSATFAPIFSSGSALKEIMMMWDILDGRLDSDGTARVGIRSSTHFVASSLSLTGGIGGFGVTFLQTDWLVESYRNIHSKTLDYQRNTYQEKQFIKNTTFVLMCEEKTDLNSFYRKLGDSFDDYLYKFIDFHTCRFDIWKFKKGEENNIPEHMEISSYQAVDDFDNLPKTQVANGFYTLGPTGSVLFPIEAIESKTPSFKDCFKKVHNEESPFNTPPHTGILQNLFQADMEEYNSRIQEGESRDDLLDPTTINYSVVFLSDFDFEYVHKITGEVVPEDTGSDDYHSQDSFDSRDGIGLFPLSIETGLIDTDIAGSPKKSYTNENLSVVGSSVVISSKTNISVIEPDTGNSIRWDGYILDHAKDIFNDDFAFSSIENKGFGCFVTGFLDMLAGGDTTVNIERDMMEANSVVDSNIIESQCEALVFPTRFAQTDGSEEESTLTDHIGSLHTSGALAADNSAEFRYWRNICPIGQLYRITGKIYGGVHVFNGDYYFRFSIDEDPENLIWIYLERGARTNTASAETEDVFTVQGRLFYPEYFKDVNLDSFVNLTTVDGIARWYRLRENTLNFIYNEMPNSPLTTKPIFVVRSNVILTPGTESNVGSDVPPVFSLYNDNTYQYGAVKTGLFDEIGDFFYDDDLEVDPTKETTEGFIQIGKGESIVCLDSGSAEVELIGLKMNMDVVDDNGDYQYEIRYNKTAKSSLLLWKFHSQLAKLSNNGEIDIRLSGFYKLVCEIGTEKDNKTFYIKFPYSQKVIEGSTNDFTLSYDFKWNPSEFDVVGVWRNESKIGSGYVNSMFTITPADGKIVFNDEVDADNELIQIEIINVSDLTSEEIGSKAYNLTKLGNRLEIRRVEDGVAISTEGSPKISDIRLNAAKDNSVERVECVFNHSSRGTKTHYIAPAYGFEYVSNDGSWFMTADRGSSRLAGDITSPYFFVDKALNFSDTNKTLDKTNETLVSIDRVFGNITSLSQPFVETRTRFTPPPIEARVVQKTCVTYSKSMEKTTLLYTDDGILNTKYSFVNFQSKYDRYESGRSEGKRKHIIRGTDETYVRTNWRHSYPVRSVETTFMYDVPLFSGNDSSPSFLIESRQGLLTGLIVKSVPNKIDEYVFSEPFELQASDASSGNESFYDFGYETFSGDKFAKRFGSFTKNKYISEARSYIRLPDTRDIERLKIKKPIDSQNDSITDAGNIIRVIGEYVAEYISGTCPQLYENKSGDYLLFFIDERNEKIMLLASKDDGHSWNRPIVGDQTIKDGEPIPIYENSLGYPNSSFGSLVGVKNFDTSISIVVFYDYNEEAIEMMVIPESLIKRIPNGIGESLEETIVEGEEEYIPTSWEKYFNDRQNIRRVLNTSIDIFSIVSSPNGALYASLISQNGSLIMMRNMNFRNFGKEGSDWIDTRVDLLHEDSNLKKALGSKSISGITMLYSGKGDSLLYIFLSTYDRDLLLFMVSPSVFDSIETTIQESVDKKQNIINEVTPALIIGDISSFSGESLPFLSTNNSFLEKKQKFDAQIISGIWSKGGKFTFFYYDESGFLKSLETNSPKGDWSESTNV